MVKQKKPYIKGVKRTGQDGRVGLSRSRAVDKRNNTLLKEYEQSLKSSTFLDKRIGEQNDDHGEFDKGIIRSQRERQVKLAKKSIYNLSDGEEDIYEDSALCFSFVKDDFDSGLLSGEDLQDDDLEAKRLKHLIRNESSGDEERRKSKKEFMEEIIRRSKLVRMEKAKHKEENEKLMDKNFKSSENSQAMARLTRDFNLPEVVHKKTASCLCLTTVRNEDKFQFSKILEAIKKWGGGIMESKSQAKTKAKERLVAKEAAQRLN